MDTLVFCPFADILDASAEFEREIIGERVKAGIKAKREKNNNQWGRRASASELQQKLRI